MVKIFFADDLYVIDENKTVFGGPMLSKEEAEQLAEKWNNETCVSCQGSGISSRGYICDPCAGTGIQGYRNELGKDKSKC